MLLLPLRGQELSKLTKKILIFNFSNFNLGQDSNIVTSPIKEKIFMKHFSNILKIIISVSVIIIAAGLMYIIVSSNENVEFAYENMRYNYSKQSEQCDGKNLRTTPTPPPIYDIVLPSELRKLVNANRTIALPPPARNLAEVLSSFRTPNLNAETDKAIAQRITQSIQSEKSRPATLTHEQIISELDFLFNLLRYSYSAYQYFGGDDVFLPLKESILEQISEMSAPLSVHSYITNLLVPLLRSVIADNHVAIDNHVIGIRSQLYMNENFILRKDESGFLTEIDGQTYRFLEAILDEQVVDGILPTLTRDGEFAWTFGYVVYGIPPAGTISPTIELTVSLENTQTNIVYYRVIRLHTIPNANRNQLSPHLYSVTKRKGITILSNRRLRLNEGYQLANFVETGAKLREEPVLILDLRGHGGGSSNYARQWIQQYTGQNIGSSVFAGNQLVTAAVGALNHRVRTDPPRWVSWERPSISVIQNENLVIVLTDNAIGSTGDAFVGMLRQLGNVLFVGSNTRGVLVTGNVRDVPLPYSRVNIRLGIQFNILPDLSPFEGVGFSPDLWVPPNASLERVLRFVHNLNAVRLQDTMI